MIIVLITINIINQNNSYYYCSSLSDNRNRNNTDVNKMPKKIGDRFGF